MTLHLTHEVLQLGLRDPFRIARSDHAADGAVTTVVVELRDDRFPDLVGMGEGYPDRFYGETPATMVAVFPDLLPSAEAALDGITDASSARRTLSALADEWTSIVRWNGAAKCALDIALHDLAGKILGIPVYELAGAFSSDPADRLHDRDR